MFFGSGTAQWLGAALVAVGVGGLAWWLRTWGGARLARAARATSLELDELAAELVLRTRAWFIASGALYAGSRLLTLPQPAERFVGVAAVLVLLAQAAVWGNGVIGFAVGRYVRRSLDQDAASATTVAILSFLGRLTLWTVVILLALDNVGVDVTALVAGVGVGGIAVALALQNVLGDLFGAFAIMLDKPFNIGDFIVVDDLLGTVEHIGLKTTRVRSLSGEQLVFSNADLLTSRIRNFKRMQERRVVFSFGVTYDTPSERLAVIPGMVRRVIEAQPRTRFDRAHFKTFGASALEFEVVYYVLTPDYAAYMDIQQEINLQLCRRFGQDGVDFAYPTQTLYLRRASSGPQPVGTRR